MPKTPKNKEHKGLRQVKYEVIKIAIKQVKLPATVFPWENGMITWPNSFPNKLASPSPKAKARIPTVAGMGGKINAVNKIPITRVTGPNTKWFSSRFLEAISVIFEITGIVLPFIRRYSQTIYKINAKKSKTIVGQ